MPSESVRIGVAYILAIIALLLVLLYQLQVTAEGFQVAMTPEQVNAIVDARVRPLNEKIEALDKTMIDRNNDLASWTAVTMAT